MSLFALDQIIYVVWESWNPHRFLLINKIKQAYIYLRKLSEV